MVIDVLIVGLTAAAAYWGYQHGLHTGALALIGFGGGLILGSRVGPLVLDGGYEDPFAPVVALPMGLIIGALLAAGLERAGFKLRIRLRRRSTADVVAGTVVAACLGLVAVWMLAALAARVDGLKDPMRDSAIVERLNDAVPPPGPLLNPEEPPVDRLPRLVGPRPNVGPANPAIRRDAQVVAAKPAVMQVHADGPCGARLGTGWIARDGIVVTNAHVIQGADEIEVQPGGKGERFSAEPIWYDEAHDIGIVRASAVSGRRALRLAPTPKPGSSAATLGYPGGGPYSIGPARIGSTTRIPDLAFRGQAVPHPVTAFRVTTAGPGSSGGPVVDERGRVVTMIFGGGNHTGYGVPSKFIRSAVLRAGPPVDTDDC